MIQLIINMNLFTKMNYIIIDIKKQLNILKKH